MQRAFRLTKAAAGRHRLGQRLPHAELVDAVRRRQGSGFGRENGTEGLHEYLQDKAVWIELTGATRDPFVLG